MKSKNEKKPEYSKWEFILFFIFFPLWITAGAGGFFLIGMERSPFWYIPPFFLTFGCLVVAFIIIYFLWVQKSGYIDALYRYYLEIHKDKSVEQEKNDGK